MNPGLKIQTWWSEPYPSIYTKGRLMHKITEVGCVFRFRQRVHRPEPIMPPRARPVTRLLGPGSRHPVPVAGTPRRRKRAYNCGQPKPAAAVWTAESIKTRLEKELKLSFVPDAWQPFILKRIMD
ncbi:hypothetical protein BDZ89DRAFT_1132667 [Hymenopellis radicata]|nr:hypothetical protein BDZ89DRAFT_1132667 [Hymenopellis radicata]